MSRRALPAFSSRALQGAVLVAAALILAPGAACDPSGGTRPAPTAVDAPSDPGAATPANAATPAVSGGTFRWAIGEPLAITPPLAADPDGFAVVDGVFDSLTGRDVTGAAVPSAAVRWSANPQLTSWTFRLRETATFHDGTAVTSADFVRAWTSLVGSGPMAHLLRDVVGWDALRRGDVATLAGVRAIDPLTLRVSLVAPRADLPIVLSHPALGPVPPPAAAGEPAHAEQPIGNGPFAMDEPWAHGDFIRLTAWAGWTNGARPVNAIGEVLFRIADVDTGFLAFRQGRRDLATVPPEALRLAAEEYPPGGGAYDGPGLITGPTAVSYLLVIDADVAPYDDVRVREALSLIVDRGQIAAENVGGNLAPASSMLPVALSPASAGMCALCTFNPTGAEDRLTAAGVSSVPFAFNAGGGHERVRDVLREDLGDIGVSLVSNRRGPTPTFEAYLARLREGAVGMFRLSLAPDVPSSLDVLLPLLHSSATPARGGLNTTGYASPRVDALLEQAARTADPVARESLLRRVEDIVVNRDRVIVPVVEYRHSLVVGEGIRNFRYGPFGDIDLHALVLTG